MHLYRKRLLTTALAVTAMNATAATLIEERDEESTTTMYVEGGMLRVETRGEPGYALMDLRKRSILLVNPDEKMVIDMSEQVQETASSNQSKTSRVTVELDHKGSGPDIAGYATEHYVLMANGIKCQDIFTSTKAFEDSGWAAMWSDFGRVYTEMAAAEVAITDCDIAESKIDPAAIGWPLKTVMNDGQTTEVITITDDVAAPSGGFEVPQGYRLVTIEQMMTGGAGSGAD